MPDNTSAPTQPNAFSQDVRQELTRIGDMLIEKNRKYGDSAMNPIRVFNRSDVIASLDVRIDDKLSRIANRQDDEDEDPELDLIGYLIMRRIARKRSKQ